MVVEVVRRRMKETIGGWSCHGIWGSGGEGVKVREGHDDWTHKDKR